jgi:hypothetical protein
MSVFFGLIVASLLNWQEKYEYCDYKKFDGKYCETAKVLHKRDLKYKKVK